MLRCSSRLLCPQLTCNLAQVHCSCFFSRHSTDQLHRLNILAAADAGSYRLSSSSSSWNNAQPCMVRDCRSWATTNTLTHSTQQQYSFNLLATRGSHSIADGCTMLPARCHTQVGATKYHCAKHRVLHSVQPVADSWRSPVYSNKLQHRTCLCASSDLMRCCLQE